MKFSHPLMHDNFTRSDINAAINLLRKKKRILTQSKHVKIFEEKWSQWLGVKYSVFVNSGSSANLLAISALTSPQLGDRCLKPGDEVITVSNTWISTSETITQTGAKPVFVDIDEYHNIDI